MKQHLLMLAVCLAACQQTRGAADSGAGYCVPETDEQLCAHLQVCAMTVDATDACGVAVRITCGACAPVADAGSDGGMPGDGGVNVETDAGGTDAGVVTESLAFDCVSHNIGAFAYLGSDMAVKCVATAFDQNIKPVSGANIQFKAEAGTMKYAGAGVLTYVPHPSTPGANAAPLDVAPLGDAQTGEPRWVDTSTPGSPTRNPRDGLATIVAWVPGDASGGLQGEPYVDANDNGMYDLGEDYKDLNGDGIWNPMQTTVIWVQTKILWTGALTSSGPTAIVQLQGSNSYHMHTGGQITLVFSLLDQNFNTLAANDSGDAMSWALTPNGDLATVPTGVMTSRLATNKIGINLDANYNIVFPDRLSSYEENSQYPITLTNAAAASNTNLPENWSINATLDRHLYLNDTGMPAGDVNSDVTMVVGGKLTQ